MNLEQGIQLFLKYLPVAIAIYKRESPTIAAFVADFKLVQSGQSPSGAPTPNVSPVLGNSTTVFPPA